MKAIGIDHVVICVSDLEASIRFYRDVLGCKLDRRRPDLEPRMRLAHLRAGSSLIDLLEVDRHASAAGSSSRNMDHVCLRIADYQPDEIISQLAKHGVCGEAPVARYGAAGMAESIYLCDPDGNGIELRP